MDIQNLIPWYLATKAAGKLDATTITTPLANVLNRLELIVTGKKDPLEARSNEDDIEREANELFKWDFIDDPEYVYDGPRGIDRGF